MQLAPHHQHAVPHDWKMCVDEHKLEVKDCSHNLEVGDCFKFQTCCQGPSPTTSDVRVYTNMSTSLISAHNSFVGGGGG
jgi:hypothetical protein